MSRHLPALVAGLLLLGRTCVAADAPAGTWKLSFPGSDLTLLIRLENKDGKWTGQFLGASRPQVQKFTVGDVAVTADSLRLSLRSQGNAAFQFDGKLPPDPKTGKIAGSLQMRANEIVLVHLEPSKLQKFDKAELDKETLEQSSDAVALLDAAVELIKEAGEKKAKIEEVRGWADKAFKPADGYGPRWQRTVATRLAQAASGQKEFAPVAVEYARKAERLLDPDEDPSVQMDVLDSIAQVLIKADKAEDAKQIQARLAKLEERDYADYLKKLPFKPDPFEGRKGTSDRVVLVELFTNSGADNGVAAEVALAALDKTFKPSEVVMLVYSLNVQSLPPDPLFVPDAIERVTYYKKAMRSFPALFVNGKPAAPGGGPLQGARKKYAELREAIEPLLETGAGAKLELTATRKNNEVVLKATASNVAKTGDNIRLRLALVEDHVRFAGGNGLRYHHFVVRAFPGGAKGLALTKKSGEQTATVNLDDLRSKLNEYLDELVKSVPDFSLSERPIALKGLRAVAFVQDDESNEVLQAAQVEVK
jgi:hypothetical protein